MPARKPKPDANTKAVNLVRTVTGSEPVRGEDLLGSPAAKRLLREAKNRQKRGNGDAGA